LENDMTNSNLSRKWFGSLPYQSNILGATGLSRAALAGMFRSNGLFGSDSSLAATEQALLLSRLPPIAGLRAPAILPKGNPRLEALSGLADALIAGDESAVSVKAIAAHSEGLSAPALSEIATVIESVRAVFGFPPEHATAAAKAPPSALRQAA
jgi:hypothetical protein